MDGDLGVVKDDATLVLSMGEPMDSVGGEAMGDEPVLVITTVSIRAVSASSVDDSVDVAALFEDELASTLLGSVLSLVTSCSGDIVSVAVVSWDWELRYS